MEERNTTGMSWINFLTAIWLTSAPFLLGYTRSISQVNDMLTGVIIGVSSFIRILFPMAARLFNWINLLGGFWLIVSPFVLSYANISSRWNDVVVGFVVLAISLMNFGREQTRDYRFRYRHFSRPSY